MLIDCICMPLDYGAGKRGTDTAPGVLLSREMLQGLAMLGHDVEIETCNVVKISDGDVGSNPKAKYLRPIADSCARLAGIVDNALCNGSFPLVIGGDHSIVLGSLAGASASLAREGKKLGVIYIDAHGDFNTPETSPSGNIHGESLAASCGYGLHELVNLYRPGVKVDPKSVCIIGARSLDPGEEVLLAEAGVTVWSRAEVRARGIGAIMEAAISLLSGRCDKIHLSFDIDSVDPAIAPGTGIHVPDGLTDTEAIAAANAISGCGMLCSADVVELNPGLDADGRTAALCRDFILHMMGKK